MAKEKITKEVIRYKENPFLNSGTNLIETKKKQVKLTPMGKGDNVLVNQHTGEVQGTHLVTFREVDAKEFVKLFAGNIALTFDLTAAGIKSFNVLFWTLQYSAISKDVVDLDKYTLEDFLDNHPQLKAFSLPTFRRGLSELTEAKIIAPTLKRGRYFINPHFCFNGDRIAFTTDIKLKRKEKLQKEISKENSKDEW